MANFIAYQVALQAAQKLAGCLTAIGRKDRDLERQMRRAARSILLNLAAHRAGWGQTDVGRRAEPARYRGLVCQGGRCARTGSRETEREAETEAEAEAEGEAECEAEAEGEAEGETDHLIHKITPVQNVRHVPGCTGRDPTQIGH